MVKSWNNMTKAQRARFGQRRVACAAIFRNGGGAHKNRNEKRQSNKKNDWRRDWD